MKITLSLVLIILGAVQNRNEAYGKPQKRSSEEVKLSDAPDLCQCPQIDAVTRTKDGNSYVFKGEYYWRVLSDGLADGYPRVIKDDWDGLPGNLNAALTWSDGKTFFFKDSRYWRFHNKKMDIGYPKEIIHVFKGIPNDIDAALHWRANNKTYFFKGSQYWRFESQMDVPVSKDYPQPISNWRGLPNDLDGAFLWENGITYFFKDRDYYRFNDKTLAVDHDVPGFPRPTAIWWFGCRNSQTYPMRNCSEDNTHVTERISEENHSTGKVHPVTEIASTKATTQSENTPATDDEDHHKPGKGSYDIGIWDDYDTTDDSTVTDVGITEEYSTTDDSNIDDVGIWKGYSTVNDSALSPKTTNFNPTAYYPHTNLNQKDIVNNKQTRVLYNMFMLLNTLLILWY